MRNRERTRDGGARIQFICYRWVTVWTIGLNVSLFSRGRNGLQSYAHEEEEARKESGGGKFDFVNFIPPKHHAISSFSSYLSYRQIS